MTIIVVGGMTIDDLVLPGGPVHRRIPGGNALYSALGALLWGVRSELVSFVGADYPKDVLDQLNELGIGTTRVARLERDSIRLWILYEEDGRRQIHLQHDSVGLDPIADIAVSAINQMLASGGRYTAHIAALPVRVQRAVAEVLANDGVSFTLDSLEAKGSVGGDLRDYLIGSDLAPAAFLPSREEFALLFGDLDSSAFRDWATHTPTATLVIKDGGAGSLLFTPPSAAGMHVPALKCDMVDPTGAGDAFCGGFAAGLALGRSPISCASMGTVAASFVVAQVGARGLIHASPEDAQRRRDFLEAATRRWDG